MLFWSTPSLTNITLLLSQNYFDNRNHGNTQNKQTQAPIGIVFYFIFGSFVNLILRSFFHLESFSTGKGLLFLAVTK